MACISSRSHWISVSLHCFIPALQIANSISLVEQFFDGEDFKYLRLVSWIPLIARKGAKVSCSRTVIPPKRKGKKTLMHSMLPIRHTLSSFCRLGREAWVSISHLQIRVGLAKTTLPHKTLLIEYPQSSFTTWTLIHISYVAICLGGMLWLTSSYLVHTGYASKLAGTNSQSDYTSDHWFYRRLHEAIDTARRKRSWFID